MKTFVVVAVLLTAVVGLQAWREQQPELQLQAAVSSNLLYVQSPEFMRRAALSYESLLADVYWIRAVQHYGRTKLSADEAKQYDLLFPLLDITTSLDPYFNIAYHFGALFLAESYPAGPERPDLAIRLLEKGLKTQPDRWQFAQDIGFIHYWWRRDYPTAAEWFRRGSEMPDGPNWLGGLAAVTLAQGGNRESSRRLWQEIDRNAEADWLRVQARFRLRQLDAMDQIALLDELVRRFEREAGRSPQTWLDLVRAGLLAGIPVDPDRYPYQLDPASGSIALSADSTLNPLPAPER